MAKTKSQLLVTLLVSAGLFGSANAELFVANLDEGYASELIQTLSHPNLNPAIFVAATTTSKKNAPGLNASIDTDLA